MAATEEKLHQAEAVKERLCSELNILVQQSARIQLQKLEQLTDRLEQLHVGSGQQKPGQSNSNQVQVYIFVLAMISSAVFTSALTSIVIHHH